MNLLLCNVTKSVRLKQFVPENRDNLTSYLYSFQIDTLLNF